MNPLRHLGRIPWTGNRPIARLLCLHRAIQHRKTRE